MDGQGSNHFNFELVGKELRLKEALFVLWMTMIHEEQVSVHAIDIEVLKNGAVILEGWVKSVPD
jgi:hypothetical protein